VQGPQYIVYPRALQRPRFIAAGGQPAAKFRDNLLEFCHFPCHSPAARGREPERCGSPFLFDRVKKLASGLPSPAACPAVASRAGYPAGAATAASAPPRHSRPRTPAPSATIFCRRAAPPEPRGHCERTRFLVHCAAVPHRGEEPACYRPTATARKHGPLRGSAGRQIRNSGRDTPSLRRPITRSTSTAIGPSG
jgi:hypothetical protein